MNQVAERLTEAELLLELRRTEAAKSVFALDRSRLLKAASNKKLRQALIASAMGITQPAVAKAIKVAKEVPDVLEGRDGATPYEVCQRYAAGMLDREVLIKELVEWPYKPTPWANEYGEYEESMEGTWQEVVDAADNGLIDDAIYDEVLKKTAG